MSDRAIIDATIRQRTLSIEVCDNDVCQQWTTGDEDYEAWITRTVDEHVAAQEVVQEAEARRQLAQQVQTALELLDNGATLAEMRVILARLIRLLVRSGTIAP